MLYYSVYLKRLPKPRELKTSAVNYEIRLRNHRALFQVVERQNKNDFEVKSLNQFFLRYKNDTLKEIILSIKYEFATQ